MHGAIQVFWPAIDPHDLQYGLNPFRLYINSFIILTPTVLAGLAFVNPQRAHEYKFGIYWLPTRPIWYQLALSWIPRYIVFAAVLLLSGAVYIYVCYQFETFRRMRLSSRKSSHAAHWLHPGLHGRSSVITSRKGHQHSRRSSRQTNTSQGRRFSLPFYEVPSHDASRTLQPHSQGRHSWPFISPRTLEIRSVLPVIAGSADTLLLNETEFARPQVLLTGTSTDTDNLSQQRSYFDRPAVLLRTRSEPVSRTKVTNSRETLKTSTFSRPRIGFEARRAAALQQVRSSFTYPLVYVALWIVPTILHCMQYRARYARDPPQFLVLLSMLCLSGMGFAHCVAFLVREQPWRLVDICPACFSRCQNVILACRRYSESSKKAATETICSDTVVQGLSGPNVAPPVRFQDVRWSSHETRNTDDTRNMKNLNLLAHTSAKASARLRLAYELADRTPRVTPGTDIATPMSLPSTAGAYFSNSHMIHSRREWWDAFEEPMSLVYDVEDDDNLDKIDDNEEAELERDPQY